LLFWSSWTSSQEWGVILHRRGDSALGSRFQDTGSLGSREGDGLDLSDFIADWREATFNFLIWAQFDWAFFRVRFTEFTCSRSPLLSTPNDWLSERLLPYCSCQIFGFNQPFVGFTVDSYNMTENNPFSVWNAILGKQFLSLLLFGIESRIVYLKPMLTRFEFLKDFRLAVLFAILFWINNNMHSVALIFHLSSCNKVRANGVLLGQISCEVHLLPFEHFLNVVSSGETKLS
jgi:hypothetical protein